MGDRMAGEGILSIDKRMSSLFGCRDTPIEVSLSEGASLLPDCGLVESEPELLSRANDSACTAKSDLASFGVVSSHRPLLTLVCRGGRLRVEAMVKLKVCVGGGCSTNCAPLRLKFALSFCCSALFLFHFDSNACLCTLCHTARPVAAACGSLSSRWPTSPRLPLTSRTW